MNTHQRYAGSVLFGAWVLLGAASFAPAAAGAQEGPIATSGGPQVPAETCTYYEHDGFKGKQRNIALGIRRKYVGDEWNDTVSSIACAERCALQVWEHRDFAGATRTFAGAYNYVGDAWNDRISSMEVSCAAPGRQEANCSYGPDTCTAGFVWREANAADHVCVSPGIRDRTRAENGAAAANRAGGGAYGPDTCKPGFVWREAFSGDVACVLPESREQAKRDNSRAGLRRACR